MTRDSNWSGLQIRYSWMRAPLPPPILYENPMYNTFTDSNSVILEVTYDKASAIVDWCRENLGEETHRTDVTHRWSHKGLNYSFDTKKYKISFYFNNIDDAALFRLIWQ